MSLQLRVTGVTVATAFLLGGLAGCAKDEAAAPTEPTIATASETVGSEESAATDLVGDWHSAEAEWTVHFADDGTFIEDFEGIEEFRRGTFRVEGDTVHLEGDDGNSTSGELSGDMIAFDLGTLERQ